MLTETQAGKVEQAVAKAEATTSSEIVVCVLNASTNDRGIAAIVGTLAFALVEVLGAAIFWNIDPLTRLGVAFVTAIVVFWLCDHFDLGLRCLPARLLIRDARREARAMFFDRGLDASAERNAVLLFVSRAERYVEILPDRAAAAAIEASQWAAIIADFRAQMRDGDLGDALAAAVVKIGVLCATRFPAGSDNPDRIANRPIES